MRVIPSLLAVAAMACTSAAGAQLLPAVRDSLAGTQSHQDPLAPNDTLHAEQWGPAQVNAEAAWHVTRGAGAVVAIVDSGVDLDHPDLAANVVRGNTFLDCGDAGCGNGDWDNGHPHGTHVAGIAAAVTDNGTGIAGVAPGASLLAVRVLDDAGSGSFADIARGIRWSVDNGADVINLSLGALPGVQALTITGVISDVVEAIEYANSNDVVVVAASGNESFPLCGSPSFDPGAICVTATDKREQKAWYANSPIKPDLLTVAAPGGAGLGLLCGEDILSTVPPGSGTDACGYPADLAYDEFAGTSMASPHAAGVAALVKSMGCTRAQTIDIVTSTARQPLSTVRGAWSPAFGYGIVDAEAAVQVASSTC